MCDEWNPPMTTALERRVADAIRVEMDRQNMAGVGDGLPHAWLYSRSRAQFDALARAAIAEMQKHFVGPDDGAGNRST